jgi:hypothetical protein
MAWKERSRMDKRLVLIGEYLKGEKPMTELCLEYGVSRKTGYKWVGCYNEGGPAPWKTAHARRSLTRVVLTLRSRSARSSATCSPALGGSKDPGLAERQAARVRSAGCQHRQRSARYGLSRSRQARRRRRPTPTRSEMRTHSAGCSCAARRSGQRRPFAPDQSLNPCSESSAYRSKFARTTGHLLRVAELVACPASPSGG